MHQLGSSIDSKGRHPQFLKMKVELGHGSFDYPFGGGIKQCDSMVILRCVVWVGNIMTRVGAHVQWKESAIESHCPMFDRNIKSHDNKKCSGGETEHM